MGKAELGFGFMRLPKKEGVFDYETIEKMVDLFLDRGFTYFDTAWGYEGSEEALKKTLTERHSRESFKVATKIAPLAFNQTKEEALSQLDVSLQRTGLEYFDYYLLHNLGKPRTQVFDDWDLWDWIEERKNEGKIKEWGFSFHSTPEELDTLLTLHPNASFVQLQINWKDWLDNSIQSKKCYDVARKHHKRIVIMEPIKGGHLSILPPSVRRAFDSSFTPSEWALNFARSLEGVSTVLSGMTTIEDVDQNTKLFLSDVKADQIDDPSYEKARQEMDKLDIIPCTSCDYCAKVCPMNIGISGTFKSKNNYTLYYNKAKAEDLYNSAVRKKGKKNPAECIKCGSCLETCPQHLDIPTLLENILSEKC